jgi:hypothetical protein
VDPRADLGVDLGVGSWSGILEWDLRVELEFPCLYKYVLYCTVRAAKCESLQTTVLFVPELDLGRSAVMLLRNQGISRQQGRAG